MNRYLRRVSSILAIIMLSSGPAFGWGEEGHRIINRTAVSKLPDSMPQFFRLAAARLEYLGPEPDRWRDTRELFSALREVNSPDHFINIDSPDNFAALPNDRYLYSRWLRAQGKDPKDIGFLPYAILENYQKLEVQFRAWRDPRNVADREQIEQNIIYYAGILGHYVGDGSNPLHVTIHYNGWSTSLNPDYETREPLHWRFEGEYIKAQIRPEDVSPFIKTPERLSDSFSDIMKYLFDSHGLVREVYRLDKTARWDQYNTNPDSKRFAASRLAAGSQMLLNLWYTAWVESLRGLKLSGGSETTAQ